MLETPKRKRLFFASVVFLRRWLPQCGGGRKRVFRGELGQGLWRRSLLPLFSLLRPNPATRGEIVGEERRLFFMEALGAFGARLMR